MRNVGLTRYFVPHAAFRWLVGQICLASLGSLVLLCAGQAVYLHRVEPDLELGLLPLPPLPVTIALVLAGVAYVAVGAAFFIHRVTGPLYRLQQEMGRVVDGHAPREVAIRRGDQLQEFFGVYNQMLYSLDLLESKDEGED